uniref:calcium/calmodulin-dependent protein kinase n=1 Tax=Pellia epiphylla TaxID=40340 RepID=E8ZA55_9MARC|nr:calcium- and calmodulin-dependent protein kinase [Pellia epiphylla]
MVTKDGSGRRTLQDDYIIGQVLGTGGFSVVRKGISRDDGSTVAVKTLKKQGFGYGSPSARQGGGRGGGLPKSSLGKRPLSPPQQPSISEALVANEIVVMRRIVEDVSPHPNVIHLLDVFDDPTGVHLVLELCSGGELFDRIVSQERYSEAGAARVVHQIANGLHSLHQAQIVHRGLKPENCLFLTRAEDSPLKIMDFGLSHIDGVTSPIVGMFGSIDYVAPEALVKRSMLPASDMWSLGVILYILLCGYPPFHARTNKEKQNLILAGNFGNFEEASWKTVSSHAKQLISSLLTVDGRQRPSAAEMLRHPWVIGDVAKQEPVDADVFRRLRSFNARRKFRAAAFASILSSKFMLRTKYLKNLVGAKKVLNTEEIQNLHNHFKRISSNGASVTVSEFQEVLKAMKLGALLPLAQRIFDLFDDNKDGCVDMREVVVGFSSLKRTHGDEALQLCFQLYDTDRSGYISRDELASMLRALPEEYLPADVTDAGKLDEMFDHMDANNDGRISFEEFKEAMQVNNFLQEAVLFPLRQPLPSLPPVSLPIDPPSNLQHKRFTSHGSLSSLTVLASEFCSEIPLQLEDS